MKLPLTDTSVNCIGKILQKSFEGCQVTDDHDRHCFMGGSHPCPVCAAISAARSDEKLTFENIWKTNLPLIEERWYLTGYQDASNGKPIPDRFCK